MEGTRRLAGVVAEAVSLFEEVVLDQATLWGEGDLLTVERQMQQVLPQVGSVLVSGVLRQRDGRTYPQGSAKQRSWEGVISIPTPWSLPAITAGARASRSLSS
jgi:hypothetical protein